MLNHPTHEKLNQLKLFGMARALTEQASLDLDHLGFEERLGLLIDRETTERDGRLLAQRLLRAKLKPNTAAEDTDYRHARGLDKALFQRLLAGQWLREKQNVLLTGPTGVGKTWLACALAHQACRQGYSAYYVRLPRLLDELSIGRADGRYSKLLKQLAKVDVLTIDDWGLAVLDDVHRRDLLEVLDDRHNARSTIVTSQLPVDHWHAAIGDATLADAILDRLVHNAHQLTLKGESLRKKRSRLTNQLAQE
ncbi:IS21-like element helper ATPase IstB [Undibacterium arcticum]|uniref:IS21-like element helper ATPase IstB n=1 Tax=Undibacterium arcticum TaxID=1762892 RepID=UPI0036092041